MRLQANSERKTIRLQISITNICKHSNTKLGLGRCFLDINQSRCSYTKYEVAIILAEQVIYLNGDADLVCDSIIAFCIEEVYSTIGIPVTDTYTETEARVPFETGIIINPSHTRRAQQFQIDGLSLSTHSNRSQGHC